MDKNSKIVIVLGIAITLLLFLIFDIYAAGIAFVLFITVLMCLRIMQDSVVSPDISASLTEDAKSVVIRNSGTAPAFRIHVALVPANTEYDVKSLAVDETNTHPLPSMVPEVKAVITFENEGKNTFTRSYSLSALGNEYEPFKPMIPLFKWK